MVGIKHESMRKGQTSHKKEHNTRMCFPLKPVFTRDKGGLPNFMDEPTIGLDVATKDRLRAFILELNRTKKVTVFLTTHDMQDVEKLCNRVILINHGRILYDGNLESVKEKYIRYRNLKVVFNKTYSIDELKFLKDFQDLRIQNLDDKAMLIQYNYKLYSVTDIVSCLLKNTEVADFSIKDLEIEDVIKEVC